MDGIETIIEGGRYAAEHGLLAGRSGNLSVREGSTIAITASGTMLGRLTRDDVIRIPIHGGLDSPPASGRKPSMETEMHRMLYRRLPDAGAVLHSQPFHSTLLACTTADIPRNLIPETMAYIGRIVRIPYRHPGGLELAELTAAALEVGDVGVLDNHGLIVAASTVDEALAITETFEMLAHLVVTARTAGLELRVLPEAVRDDFLGHLKRIKAVARA